MNLTAQEQIAEVEAKMKQYYKKLLDTRQSRIDGIFTGLCYALEAMGVSGDRIGELMNEVKASLL